MKTSSVMPLPGSTLRPEVQRAILRITGWATRRSDGQWQIGAITVTGMEEQVTDWHDQRVTATLYPGRVHDHIETCQVASIRAAGPREANAATFEATGHLVRAERSTLKLQLTVYPQRKIPRIPLRLHMTAQTAWRCDPTWTGVSVKGCLIGTLVVIDEIVPAYTPIAAHWGKPRRPPRSRRSPRHTRPPLTPAPPVSQTTSPPAETPSEEKTSPARPRDTPGTLQIALVCLLSLLFVTLLHAATITSRTHLNPTSWLGFEGAA